MCRSQAANVVDGDQIKSRRLVGQVWDHSAADMDIDNPDSVSGETLSASVHSDEQPVQPLHQGQSHTRGESVADDWWGC